MEEKRERKREVLTWSWREVRSGRREERSEGRELSTTHGILVERVKQRDRED